MKRFPPAVQNSLKYYVYLFIDPRNNEIFYVGKGTGNRCFSHLDDKTESQKTQRISELDNAGLKPVIEILIHGLDEASSLRVEASVIDLIGISKLTNIKKGHASSKLGRMSLEKLVSIYNPERAEIIEPSLLIKINQTFYYGMSPQELYDATRQFWRIGAAREQVKLAFSVFDGTIQEIYEIVSWHPAGTTFSTRKMREDCIDRWEFVGRIANDSIRNKYLYKDVTSLVNGQNPFRYINIDSSNLG